MHFFFFNILIRKKTLKEMSSPGKALRNWFESDETMKKLMEGKLAWGNILESPKRKATRRKSSPKSASTRKTPSRSAATPKAPHPTPWSSLPSTSTRILSQFETPRIHDPRDLLEHFPIDLLRVRDSDVIAIVWNNKLLKQWKNERPTSYNEHMEYEMYTEYRLVHTLRQHKDLFEILAPKRDDEIVRIRFHRPRTPPVRLVRPEDIYKQFPGVIVDRNRDGRQGKDTRGIIIRGDFKRRHSRDEIARMTADLMRSLYASKYWKVLPAERDDEICRIEMSHA
jgi:hypothetical protein